MHPITSANFSGVWARKCSVQPTTDSYRGCDVTACLERKVRARALVATAWYGMNEALMGSGIYTSDTVVQNMEEDVSYWESKNGGGGRRHVFGLRLQGRQHAPHSYT
jgi:hypothetical protein